MTKTRITATALSAIMLVGISAPTAEAYRFNNPDRSVSKTRVVYTEPDNGRSLIWGLNNGAAFKTRNPAACKNENRPRMCRKAYNKAVRTWGCWWTPNNMSGNSVKDCRRKHWWN